MRDAQEWADENSEELHEALDEAGASQMMHAFVNVQVPFRHSVVEELYKWDEGDSADSDESAVSDAERRREIEEAIETAQRLGGGFFQKVWEGDVLEAFKHADGNNQRIIAEAYGKDYLLAQASSEMERNIVNERWPLQTA